MASAESVYLFRHALVRDAAYQLQPVEDRAALHTLAIDAFENLGDDELAEAHAGEIADHAAFAVEQGNADPALAEREYHWRSLAAKRAKAQYMHGEGEAHLMRLLELASTEQQKFDTLNDLTSVYETSSRYQDGLAACARMEEIADDAGNLAMQADAAKRRAWMLGHLGRNAEANDVLEFFMLPMRAANDLPRLAGLLSDAGTNYRAIGLFDKADECYREAYEISLQIGTERGIAVVLLNRAAVNILRQRRGQAIPDLERALELLRRLGDEPTAATCLSSLGSALQSADSKRAWTCFEEALQIANRVGSRTLQASQVGGMAHLLAQQGEYDKSIRLRLESLAITREVGELHSACIQLGNLGDTYHKLGRIEDAEAALIEALELARTISAAHMVSYWATTLAQLRVEQGRHDEAARLLAEALPAAERNNDQRLHGAVEGLLAVIARARGDEKRAQSHWRKATELLTQANATDELKALGRLWDS